MLHSVNTLKEFLDACVDLDLSSAATCGLHTAFGVDSGAATVFLELSVHLLERLTVGAVQAVRFVPTIYQLRGSTKSAP